MKISTSEVTALLRDWTAGDRDALERLAPLVYEDLKKIARNKLRNERTGHTLQPTALVNEAYLRLAGQSQAHWICRSHFFAVAARIMRRILVDHARRRRADKRHALVAAIPLEEADEIRVSEAVDLIRLDDALEDLARVDPRQSRIVELRYFAGLTIDETAAVLRISPATVKLDWKMAKARLYRELAA